MVWQSDGRWNGRMELDYHLYIYHLNNIYIPFNTYHVENLLEFLFDFATRGEIDAWGFKYSSALRSYLSGLYMEVILK